MAVSKIFTLIVRGTFVYAYIFFLVNPKHVQEKLAHDLKHSKENMDHGNGGHEKIKIGKYAHHEEYPDVVAYKISDSGDLQDGISQTPRGAVLSVTLGMS